MASARAIIYRGISTSCACLGKRNFRKFYLGNKRGSRDFKKRQSINPDPQIPIDKRGVRDVGRMQNGVFVEIPEMIPELVVPSLEGFTLKPYVTYASLDITQSEFTAKDLFDAVYAKKILEDFNNGKLGPDGEPLEPSLEEMLTPEEAKALAGSTGCDIFDQVPRKQD